jgi:polyferredoxin
VNVCPTGIDIRQGLQLECIGCAACIDACDEVMQKTGRPKGLVRYDSLKGITGKKRRILRPRLMVYIFMGALGLTAFTVAAARKARPYTADFTRMRGQPFYADSSSVRNHFQIRFHNKRNQTATCSITLKDAPPGFTLSDVGNSLTVPARGEITRPLIIVAPTASYTGPVDLTIEAHANPGNTILRHTMRFLGPDLHNEPTH